MEKLVSVVIPSLGGEKTIVRAIQSVLNQTYQNFEIIVVLDMPFGKTEEIIKDTIKDKRVRILKVDKKVNGSYARNIGINSAKGEYIALLDDDDEWFNLKLNNQIKFLENNSNYRAVLTDFIYANNDKYQYVNSHSKNYTKDILMLTVKVAGGSNILGYTEDFKKLNGFDTSFEGHQDLEFLIRLNELSKIGHIKGYLLKINGSTHRASKNTDHLLKIKSIFLSKFKKEIEAFPKSIQKSIYARHWLQISRGYSIEGRLPEAMQYLKQSLSYKFLFSSRMIIFPAESYFLILLNLVFKRFFK
jgi:glycosyltransferase involved in cell wall biosynthesis